MCKAVLLDAPSSQDVLGKALLLDAPSCAPLDVLGKAVPLDTPFYPP